MPLRAFVDGKEVIAPLWSDAEWEVLRLRVQAEKLSVVLPCCDREGYLRRSRLGTRHFAHKRATSEDAPRCDMEGETMEHLQAKADIVRASQYAGYRAAPEIPGDGWRADVLATRSNGSGRIAFEVQWSFLRLEDCVFRQDRYARDGVRGCWFFRSPPPTLLRDDDGGPELKARRELPIFHLWVNADRSFSISLNRQLYPLGDFVHALLKSQIQYCSVVRARRRQQLRFAFVEIPCERCGRSTHIYHLDTHLISRCGIPFPPEESWYSDTFAFHPQIRAAVARITNRAEGSWIRMGAVVPRTSSRENETYTAFGCVHCDAMLDRTYVDMSLYGGRRLAEAYETDSYPVEVTFAQPPHARMAHWCYPPKGAFCCKAPPPRR
jgi:hypothetical protein